MAPTLQETRLTAAQIEELITGFVGDELGGGEPGDVDPEENLLTSGLVDSVGIVRLIAHLKERLNVTVPPSDLVPANFRTIRVMAAYLHGRQGV